MRTSTKRAPVSSTPGSRYESLAFVDFGCGKGGSYSFASSMEQGLGLGIDVASDSVETCTAKGIPAEVGNLLEIDYRSIATASFAVNVVQELPGRTAFEHGLANMIRASRNYTLVQHSYFDADGDLARQKIMIPGNDHKKIQYKPTVLDYVSFARHHFENLNLVGLGIFGLGTVAPVPLNFGADTLPHEHGHWPDLFRSTRVIFGRRELSRFRAALQKSGAGRLLFIWERD